MSLLFWGQLLIEACYKTNLLQWKFFHKLQIWWCHFQLFPSLSSMTNMSITAPSCDINSAQHPLPCTYIGLCLFLRSNWCVWSNEAWFDWNATLQRQTAHFWTAPATHKNAVIGAAMAAAWCTSRTIHRSELTRPPSWPIQKYSCSMC